MKANCTFVITRGKKDQNCGRSCLAKGNEPNRCHIHKNDYMVKQAETKRRAKFGRKRCILSYIDETIMELQTRKSKGKASFIENLEEIRRLCSMGPEELLAWKTSREKKPKPEEIKK